MLGVFSIAALLVFYINSIFKYAIFYCIGIFLFIFSLVGAAFGRLYGQIEENASIKTYKKLAYTDIMTGMKNRAAFMNEQEKGNTDLGRTYIILDINNLKWINDQYGHQEGDRLIIDAAKYIKEAFEKTGTCFLDWRRRICGNSGERFRRWSGRDSGEDAGADQERERKQDNSFKYCRRSRHANRG